MIIIECEWNRPIPSWRIGSFRSRLGRKNFRRYWWRWFAISFWPGDLKEYGEAIRYSVWIEKETI